MNIEAILQQDISKAIETLYGTAVGAESIKLETTKQDFEGDYTFVVFPYLRASKKNPEQTAADIGNYLKDTCDDVADYNVVKGFLNLVVADNYWVSTFYNNIAPNKDFGKTATGQGHKVMVEYSSPNTNKPLHLGHVRNNLLGFSISQILEFNSYEVIKANLINDRGIHICKSMLAWQKFGNGETPESSGLKGDHLVGKYYVEFDKAYKAELDRISKEAIRIISDIGIQEVININNSKISAIENSIEETKRKTIIDSFLIGLGTALIAKAFSDQKKESWDWPVLSGATASILYSQFNDDSNINDKLKAEIQSLQLQNTIHTILTKNRFKVEEKFKIYNLNESDITDFYKKLIEELKNSSPIIREAQEMLLKWEAGDEEVKNLWQTMNGWVYAGFDATYKRLGVSFDKFYYESQTYLLGKEIVQEGLDKNVFYREEDSSVWIDLTDENLDKKLLLRRDGTSVYMTQDLGTADKKFEEYGCDKSVYVVGNEQEYHFKVLFSILKKMGKSYADGLYHLSYGMVDLPEGKMKSREGTVVDADDLMDEMHNTARELTLELGKIDGFNEAEQTELFETLGLGALKYFLLRVDPMKRLVFNPKESIDFAGNTGPFIQYTHARIHSLLKNITESGFEANNDAPHTVLPQERDLIVWLSKFPKAVEDAGREYNPAIIANYTYELAKLYNRFYRESPVNKEPDENLKAFRVVLTKTTGQVLIKGLALLGIKAPERM